MYGLRGLGAAEKTGPPVDPNVPVVAPDVQQQIADIWDTIFSQGTPAVVVPGEVPTSTFTAWLNANATTVAIAAAAGLGLILFAKAGR